MRARTTLALLLVGAAAISSAVPAWAQTQRPDAIWARSTAGSHITLDGVMDEPAWGSAESVIIHYGLENGIPGSGWKDEGGHLAKDSTNAILKFLVDGNSLYVGFDVKDKSIGGSVEFNRFDGLLMALKDHSQGVFPAPPAEYFYSWWYPVDTVLASTPGTPPCFRGMWGTEACSQARTPAEISAWDAKTYVHGLSNSDAVNDTGYTVEMKFNLTPMGYNVTQPTGDVIEWNCSIYDVDWNWPISLANFSSNRTWIQSPWGNAAWYNELHIYGRPDVTINSGPVPKIPFDLYIPAAGSFARPVIDGSLSDPVWANVPGFDIRWDDAALRASYPEVGKWRSGQYQPAVNGGLAGVLDPADATVKMVTKADTLYIGLDVRDQVVQYHPVFDRWDGAIVTITDRLKRWTDHNLHDWRASFQVNQNGTMLKRDDLPYLADTLRAVLGALQLKAGTTVDTVGLQGDTGYTAELAFDLTKFGYPDGLGDRQLFLGLDLLDGDSFTPYTLSYGTRTWWYMQYNNECCPAAIYMDPSYFVLGVGPPGPAPESVMLGASPNPFRATTRIRYALSDWANVSLEVYDVLGRQVSRRELGLQPPGEHDAVLGREGLSTSMYLVRMRIRDPVSGALKANLVGKVMHLK